MLCKFKEAIISTHLAPTHLLRQIILARFKQKKLIQEGLHISLALSILSSLAFDHLLL